MSQSTSIKYKELFSYPKLSFRADLELSKKCNYQSMQKR